MSVENAKQPVVCPACGEPHVKLFPDGWFLCLECKRVWLGEAAGESDKPPLAPETAFVAAPGYIPPVQITPSVETGVERAEGAGGDSVERDPAEYDERFNQPPLTIGEKIIDAIIRGGLCHATCAHDSEHGCVIVWSSGASEQIDALVAKAEGYDE